MPWAEILKSLASWGPGSIIAGFMILAFYKLAKSVGISFVEAQQDQAKALGRQAQSMEGFQRALTIFVARDNNEHREMIILLKFISESIDGTATKLGKLTERISKIEAREDAD
jgi:hypothetical protein